MNLKDFNLVEWKTDIVKSGQRYGELTIVALGKNPFKYRYYAICQCDCGSPPKAIRFSHLKDGRVNSCKCIVRTHGCTKHPLYPVWLDMMRRCYNKRRANFKHYGNRGIKVCKRWHDPNNFISDMFPSYQKELQIDRIDNNGDYFPANCKWSTRKEQCRNRTSNVNITYNGETKTLTEWSKETGIKAATIKYRLQIGGWSVDEAMTSPLWNRK